MKCISFSKNTTVYHWHFHWKGEKHTMFSVRKNAEELFVVGRSQNTTYTIQGAWRTRTSRWLLPESRRLVVTEHPQCGLGVVRLSVECMYQSGECIKSWHKGTNTLCVKSMVVDEERMTPGTGWGSVVLVYFNALTLKDFKNVLAAKKCFNNF